MRKTSIVTLTGTVSDTIKCTEALTSVRLHVFVEVLLHVEVLPAPLTHELFVSDVDAHVGPQLIFVLEALAAVLQPQTFGSPHDGATIEPRERAHTSHLKGFSPECCSEWTFRDMLRLKDFPHVSQVNGMSLVWAERTKQDTASGLNNEPSSPSSPLPLHCCQRAPKH